MGSSPPLSAGGSVKDPNVYFSGYARPIFCRMHSSRLGCSTGFPWHTARFTTQARRPMNRMLLEPAQEIPMAAECDGIIGGGGTARIPAAVAAVRHGARIVLFWRFGFVSEVAAFSIMPCWQGRTVNHSGLLTEFGKRVAAFGKDQTFLLEIAIWNPRPSGSSRWPCWRRLGSNSTDTTGLQQFCKMSSPPPANRRHHCRKQIQASGLLRPSGCGCQERW